MGNTKLLEGLVLVCIGLSSIASQAGTPVAISVGDYARTYEVQGYGKLSGNQVLDLEPGTYQFSNLTSEFEFTVLSDGSVVSQSPASAQGNGSTLSLNTQTIAVDPGQFSRRYEALGGGKATGPRSIVTVTGLEDTLLGPAGTPITRFTANPDQTLTIDSGEDCASSENGGIRFRNALYEIDPGSFDRRYQTAAGAKTVGPSTAVGIPGMIDTIANDLGSDIARFEIDGAGNVTLLDGFESVTAQGNRITFESVPLNVDPGAYPRLYAASGGQQRYGQSRIYVIPGVLDRLSNLSFYEILRFVSDRDGNLTAVSGAANVELSRGAISFRNTAVSADPRNYAGSFQLFSGQPQSGAQTLILIPGVAESLSVASQSATLMALEDGIQLNGVTDKKAVLNIAGSDGKIEFQLSPVAHPSSKGKDKDKTPEDRASVLDSGGGCVPSAHASSIHGRGPAHDLGDLLFGPWTLSLAVMMLRRRKRQAS